MRGAERTSNIGPSEQSSQEAIYFANTQHICPAAANSKFRYSRRVVPTPLARHDQSAMCWCRMPHARPPFHFHSRSMACRSLANGATVRPTKIRPLNTGPLAPVLSTFPSDLERIDPTRSSSDLSPLTPDGRLAWRTTDPVCGAHTTGDE